MQFAALHPESRLLLGTFNSLNGIKDENLPSNHVFNENTGLIDRLFMAQKMGDGVFSFRTVGKDLKIWTGRDLRDHEIASLFHGADKALIRSLLEAALSSAGPALARVAAFGVGEGQRTEIEMVFLPLLDKNGTQRILGLFQPLSQTISVSRPILRFALTALLPPDPSPPIKQPLRVV